MIDYGFHGVIPYGVGDNTLEEMEKLIDDGIESFKIYMTYGQMVDDDDSIKILKLAVKEQYFNEISKKL